MINVIGLGYIGLPTALIMAANEQMIVGTDINQELVRQLKKRELPFEEEGIEEVFEKALDNGITFQTTCVKTDCYIITVPTPYLEASKQLDITYLKAAIVEVLKNCLPETTLIIESTISPGTIDRMIRPLLRLKGFELGRDIHLVHAPERILPGQMIHELKNNSRTIGADDSKIAEQVKELYASFCDGEIVCTDIKTAEMTKVVENTFRAVNIAFANELVHVCAAGNMNVYDVINIANKHPRVSILTPGPGVGGHCIPVDPWFLVGDYPQQTSLVKQALTINEQMPAYILKRAAELAKEHKITSSEIGIYGLAYKKNVDDIRESPTMQMYQHLDTHFGYDFTVYDPFVEKQIRKNQVFQFEEFLEKVKMIIVMVDHQQLLDNKALLKDKIIFDTRHCLLLGQAL